MNAAVIKLPVQVDIFLTLRFHISRMKKKRKRSSSSSSSTSSSRSSSSSSSSSSARRRSKKKKKKKHRSKRRVSSRSNEGKSRKERKEEEELEWFPAPPNTSATFLNQRGGPWFGAEEDGPQERCPASLYSLPGASDDDDRVSNSSHRGSRGSVTERRSSQGGSTEQVERERRDRSREGGSDRRRRSSLDGDARRRESCSSTEHDSSRRPGSARIQPCHKAEASVRRNSSDLGRYEGAGRGWTQGGGSSTGGQGSRAAGNGTPVGQGGTRPTKELPSNLLNIFNQIAQFEKEKGGRAKL